MAFTYVVEAAAAARNRGLTTAEVWSLGRRGETGVGGPLLGGTDGVMSGGGCGRSSESSVATTTTKPP